MAYFVSVSGSRGDHLYQFDTLIQARAEMSRIVSDYIEFGYAETEAADDVATLVENVDGFWVRIAITDHRPVPETLQTDSWTAAQDDLELMEDLTAVLAIGLPDQHDQHFYARLGGERVDTAVSATGYARWLRELETSA